MIKILLKHTIAEQAINTFFDKMNKNFAKPIIPDIYIGQRFHIIEEVYRLGTSIGIHNIRNTLYNTTVVDVDDIRIKVTSDRKFLEENLTTGRSTNITIGNYHTIYRNLITYIE